MVHHRAFSLKNLGYWWEHRQTTERFHSRVLVTDGSTHTPQSVFTQVLATDGSTDRPQSVFTQESWLRMGAQTDHRAFSLKSLGYGWEHRQTTERFHSRVLVTDGSTDRPQSVFTQESWLRMGAQTDRSVFPQESGILMWVQITVYFPSRIWDTDVSTDNSVFSLKNHGFTCPHRPQNVFTQEPQINPLGPRPPVTAHSFSLPWNPRPSSSGQLADAPY